MSLHQDGTWSASRLGNRACRPTLLQLESREMPGSYLDLLFMGGLSPPASQPFPATVVEDPAGTARHARLRTADGEPIGWWLPPEPESRGVRVTAQAPRDDSAPRRGDDLLGSEVGGDGGRGLVQLSAPHLTVNALARGVFVDVGSPGPVGVIAPAATAPTIVQADGASAQFASPTVPAVEPLDDVVNQAPVATGEIVSLAEDTSLTIDVLANDTDADGDKLAVDTWTWETGNALITQESDGRLKYTPQADFFGQESFSYTVTDGRAVSSSVSVMVTVTSVNDAPVAFNDAYIRTVEYKQGMMPPTGLGDGPGYVAGNVLTNDIDYDPGSMWTPPPPGMWMPPPNTNPGVGNGYLTSKLVSQPSVGSVMMFDNGVFYYMYPTPSSFTDLKVSFTYQAYDKHNPSAASNTATATLWVHVVPPPRPTIPTNDLGTTDEDVTGDDVLSDSVTPMNGSGYEAAVLVTHPTVGRMKAFEYSGKYEFDPRDTDADTSFTYLLIGTGGWLYGLGKALLPALDFTIYDGQNSMNGFTPKAEGAIGAVTVFNNNDTDSDYTKDLTDPVVKAGGPESHDGVNEVDLMKVVIKKPAVANLIAPVTVTATQAGKSNPWFYTGPNADINEFKGSTVTLNAADFAAGDVTLWLEARDYSAAVKDISVNMSYLLANERAKATSIWAMQTLFRATGQSGTVVVEGDKETKVYRSLIERETVLGGRTGVLGVNTMPFTRGGFIYHVNPVEIEFTLHPTGIAKQPRVKFDVSRSVADVSGKWDATTAKFVQIDTIDFEPNRDKANDDPHGDDEVCKVPLGDKVYAMDSPGLKFTAAGLAAETDFFHHMNALEFVRVRFDGGAFAHAAGPPYTLQGSRCSELEGWHTKLYFAKRGAAPGVWARPLDAQFKVDPAYNKIDLGLLPMPIAMPAAKAP
jgi:hypothetical protein